MIGEGGRRCVTKEEVYSSFGGVEECSLQEVVSKLRLDRLVNGGNYGMGEEFQERK